MLKRIVFMLALLCAVPAFAQVGAYSSTAIDTTGRRISKPTVKVCADSACASTSTIYSDANSTALANPFTGDTQGNYSFWAAPGNYWVQVAKSGYATVTTPITLGGIGSGSGTGASFVTHDLMVDYQMTEGTGSTLVDHTSNHNDGTFPGAGSNPSWTSLGISFAGSQFITLPAAVNTAKTIVACGNFADNANQYTNAALMVSTNGTTAANLFIANQRGKRIPSMSIYAGGTRKTSGANGAYGTHCLTYVLSATTDRLYTDASESGAYDTQGASFGLMSGQWQLGGASSISSAWLQGTLYWVKMYAVELTAAEIAQNYDAFKANLTQRGVAWQTTRSAAIGNRILAIGDSLTYGFIPSAPADPYLSHVTFNETYSSANKLNLGFPGATCADHRENFNDLILPNISTNAKNLAVIWCGTNDITTFGSTPADTYQQLVALAQTARRNGARVMVMTMISRVSQDTNKNSYNALIRAGWPQFADSLCDLASQAPAIGADGANSNLTYFQADGTHLTDAGYTLVGTTVSGCVNAFTGRQSDDLLYSSATTAITGNAADQVLCSVTIPANTIPPGGGFRARIVFQKTGGTGNWTFKWNLGSGSLSYAAIAIGGTSNYAEVWFRNNTASLTGQKAWASPIWAGATSAQAAATAGYNFTNNMAADQTFTFTGNAANTESLNVQMCNWRVENP